MCRGSDLATCHSALADFENYGSLRDHQVNEGYFKAKVILTSSTVFSHGTFFDPTAVINEQASLPHGNSSNHEPQGRWTQADFQISAYVDKKTHKKPYKIEYSFKNTEKRW